MNVFIESLEIRPWRKDQHIAFIVPGQEAEAKTQPTIQRRVTDTL